LTVIRNLGLPDARLRWPNDILIGRRKLAGILVDRFSAEAAVVGIGLNVANHPEKSDPALAGEVACLADLLPNPPPISALVVRLLAALTREHHRLESDDASGLCSELNGAWSHRQVQVTLSGGRGAIAGRLDGINPSGALLVRDTAGQIRVLPAPQVELLREVFPS
jgi:BirA family biotin operon repressor/biotin-[acetyl-CoA-carboxylase] ligase